MPVETPSLFAQVIQEHLELRDRNRTLEERGMTLQQYMAEDPFENHPLFKTEEQARLEETLEGIEAPALVTAEVSLGWPGEESAADEDSGLWSRSRDFDWGD
jgi:hypothetical protein